MSTTEDELRDFTAFVLDRISRGEAGDLGLTDLFDLWVLRHPTDSERAINIAAINASMNDFLKGERGTLAGEHSLALRQKFGLDKK